MDINFELYKVFYCVATALSFSEASRQLYISQSAVSQSVKALEQRLGQSLFLRNTKKVRLTPAGQILLRHIEPAIHLIQQGEAQLQNAEEFGFGPLRIGASDTICRYILTPYLSQFHQKYPNVPIKVTNAASPSCADLLHQGKVDLAVTNDPNAALRPSCIRKNMLSFQDVFIANPSCFPFGERAVSFQELADCPLLMLNRASATCAFLRSLFLQHQLALNPEIELNSNDLLIDLARIGLGIAFLPDFCVKNPDKDLIILRTREEIPARSLIVSTSDSLPVSASAEAFLNLLPEAQCRL